MPNKLGIDISHHNKDVRKLGRNVSFVIHKATEGATWQDHMYNENRQRVADITPRDVLWGAYHVIRETSSIVDQVVNFFNTAKLAIGDLAAVDLEHEHAVAMVEVWGQEQAFDALIQFAKGYHKFHGARLLLYASTRSLEPIIGNPTKASSGPGNLTPQGAAITLADHYELWFVRYTDIPWKYVPVPDPPCWPAAPVLQQILSAGPASLIGQHGMRIDMDVCFDINKLVGLGRKHTGIEPLHENPLWSLPQIMRAFSQTRTGFSELSLERWRASGRAFKKRLLEIKEREP